MLSAGGDLNAPPKKRITTYGKNRSRTLLSSTSDSAAPTTRTPAASVSQASKPTPKNKALARSSSPDELWPKEKDKPVVGQARRNPVASRAKSAGSRDAAVPPDPADTSASSVDARPSMKRKPAHQQTDRHQKKQRSSSPDIQERASPQRAASRPVRRQSPAKATTGSVTKGTADSTSQRSIPIRPPRKLKMQPKTIKDSATSTTALSTDSVGVENPQVHPSDAPMAMDITPVKAAPARRRPRLIDSLTAQAESNQNTFSDSDEYDDDDVVKETPRTALQKSLGSMGISSPAPNAALEPPKPPTFSRQSSMPKKPGLKHTYSQQRTMLADDAFMDGLDPFEAEELAFSQPLTAPTSQSTGAFDYDFDDGLVEDAASSGAVRGIHELRKAGANNRTTDEMNDILDRVGTPSSKVSSVRRTALIEMAQQVQDKTFRRHFLMHDNGTSTLLTGIGSETDPIAGFLIAAILTTLLGTATSSNISRQLVLEDVAQLLALLLSYDADISLVAKDRKSNMSKFAQNTVTAVKTSLLQLKIWEPAISQLSPRTLALMCMQQIMQQTAADELFSPDMTCNVFDILVAAAATDGRNARSWDFPTQPQSVDLFLALSLLVPQSPIVMQSGSQETWNSKHLPTIASLLETSLSQPDKKPGDLEVLVLKLAMNTANHNEAGQAVFIQKGLLRRLVEVAHAAFKAVLRTIAENTFVAFDVDLLALMLGVSVNVSENYELAGEAISGFEPFDQLVRFFHDYSAKIAEADSEAKTSLNVACGFLAVMLGQLCRHRPTRKRIESLHTSKSIEPLVTTIREFATISQKHDSAHGGEDDPNRAAQLQRLWALIDDLEQF